MSEVNDAMIERISKYLRNELPHKEKVDFEKDLIEDKSLRDEFDAQQMMFDLIELDTLAQLKSATKNEFSKRNKARKVKNGIGIGVVLGVVVGSILLFNNSEKKNAITSKNKIVKPLSQPNVRENKPLLSKGENEKRGDAVPVELNVPRASSPKNIIKADIEVESEVSYNEEELKVENDSSFTMKENVGTTTRLNKDSVVEDIVTLEKTQVKICDTVVFPEFDIIHPSISDDDGVINFKNTEGFEFQAKKDGDDLTEVYQFTNLESGDYKVSAMHLSGCRNDYEIISLRSTSCSRNRSFIFESAFEEELQLAIIPDLRSDITIFSKRNTVLLKTSSVNEDYFIWNRELGNGELASPGTYIILIETENYKPCKYSVVVTE